MPNTLLSLDKNIPILVIDNLPMVRRMLRHCLRQLGFENVQEAEDSVAAASMLESESFNLVISDSEMPDMQPAEFLSRVRSAEKTKSAPVLFVSSANAKTPRKESEINDPRATFIIKPFTARQIEQCLEKII